MIQRFHEQFFQRMSPERRARKLSVMKALARASFRSKNKENEDPLNNNMALPFTLKHSTPLKSHQITDLDVEPEPELELELKEAEICLADEREVVEKRVSHEPEPQLVISKMYDSPGDVSPREPFHNPPGEPVDVVVAVTEIGERTTDDAEKSNNHWRSLEVLDVTAEDEFCRSLEESKLFVSTSSLLEEIEADLPSPYSLARPLNHTFHTLSSYRTLTRLARMDPNLTCPVIVEQRKSLEVEASSRRLDFLEVEAVVQNSLVRQAEKALALSKNQKFLGMEHLECEKALLLANLRHNAAIQEAQKVKMFGEISEKENFGQITISGISFAVESSTESFPGYFICTATERENVQSTSVVSEVAETLLHFDESFKFQDLGKNFVIYIELFRLHQKEQKKATLPTSIVRKLKKITAVNPNRSLLDSTGGHGGGFECIACAELRLEQIAGRESNECLLYFAESPQPPIASSSVKLLVETDLHLKSKKSGFLNVFRQTWHRRWYHQSGYFLESWMYPEDQEANKGPLESLYLATCVAAVKEVGPEVCIRRHSFVLSTGTDEEFLFSADSHGDMLRWIGHLNMVIEHIRLWKPTS